MTRYFVEGNQLFAFDASWIIVVPWDKHGAYLRGLERVDGSKAVDFIGVRKHTGRDILFFMEMKDYRVHRRHNDQDPWRELGLKVRDTVAGVVGAYRTASHPEPWAPIIDTLCARQQRVRVIFWLEQPVRSDILKVTDRRRRRAGANFRTQKSKRDLAWLNVKVLHTSVKDSSYRRALPGVEVTELPRQLPARGQKIIDILRQRGLAVPEAVATRVCELVSDKAERDIDDWICRAWTVDAAAQLLPRHR